MCLPYIREDSGSDYGVKYYFQGIDNSITTYQKHSTGYIIGTSYRTMINIFQYAGNMSCVMMSLACIR